MTDADDMTEKPTAPKRIRTWTFSDGQNCWCKDDEGQYVRAADADALADALEQLLKVYDIDWAKAVLATYRGAKS